MIRLVSTANANFDNALRLHKKADLTAAEPLYRAVLQDDPNHIDANCMLGALLIQTGNIEESLRLLRKVVSLQPNHFVAQHSLGHALKAQGDIQAAIEQYRKAVRINPGFVDGLNSLGCALRDTRQYDEAAAAFVKLTDVDPTYAPGHFNLGLVHFDRHEFDLAIRRFHDAIDWDTGCFEAYFYLGHAYRDKKDYDQAIAYYDKALQIRPREARIVTDIGTIFQRKKDFSEAQRWYERALSLNPELPEALCNMGTLCQERGAYDDAMTYYEHALGIHPDYVECLIAISDTYQKLGRAQEALASAEYAMYLAPDRIRVRLNLGKALLWNYRFEESEHQLEWCLSKKPEHTDALMHMGLLNVERGRPELALQWFNRLIEKNPDDNLAHWHRGLVLLTLGRLEQGWQESDWLISTNDKIRVQRHTYPVWKGENLSGKSILVHMDCSPADAIMFASCMPDLLAMGCQCVVECDHRLVRVLKRSFPTATVTGETFQLASDPSTEVTNFDFQCPVAGLPRYLRASMDAFPRQMAYLKPDVERSQHWRRTLLDLGPGPKIGLAWRRQKNANATSGVYDIGIDDIGEWVTGQSAVFVALADGNVNTDIALLAQHYGVTVHRLDGVSNDDDYDELFALVAALDLVIAANECAFHVAASMGKPAWLLSMPRREWITLGTNGVPWYPSAECFNKIGREEWNISREQWVERLRVFDAAPSQVTTDAVVEVENESATEAVVTNGAASIAVQAVDVHPPQDSTYAIALTRYREGDLDGAEEFCQQGLEQNPNDTRLLCLMSTVFADTERGAVALALLEKARRLNSSDASICIQLAQVYGLLGYVREEVESLAAGCELIPHDGEIHLKLALALERHGNIEGASLAAQLALLLLLESPEAKALLTRVGFITGGSVGEGSGLAVNVQSQLDCARKGTPAVDTLRLLSWDGSTRIALEHHAVDPSPDFVDPPN